MKQRLIIHIGHPKTGTTTLQSTLKNSRTALEKHKILYPNTGNHHNHKFTLPYLINSDVKKKASSTRSPIADVAEYEWHHVEDDIRNRKPDTIILSSESFFRNFGNNAIKNLCRHLKPLASRVIIAAYIREPASFAMSRAQQQLKMRSHFNLLPSNYYQSRLNQYPVCGLGTMNIRVFDRNSLIGGDIVEDFFAQHFPQFNLDLLSRTNEMNSSLSAEAMSLMQELNRKERMFPGSRALYAIKKTDRQLPGFTRPRMHEHVSCAIQARCEDLGWLRDKFNVRFPEVDATKMSYKEANRVYDRLDRVEDICNIDTERKDALWAAACEHF